MNEILSTEKFVQRSSCRDLTGRKAIEDSPSDIEDDASDEEEDLGPSPSPAGAPA